MDFGAGYFRLKPFWNRLTLRSLIVTAAVFLLFFCTTQITFAGHPGHGDPDINAINQVAGANESWFYFIVVGVFGSLAGLFGWVFDVMIEEFIVGFGDLYLNSSTGAVIDDIWSTVRDIFNLTFIFGLVYIGFQIILGINDSQAKRTIGWLILAALLVNFSLFITKFVVDFSNIAAVQVYNLFESAPILEAGASAEATLISTSISRAFINSLEIAQILGTNIGGTGETLFIFASLIIFLVLSYVFLAGAILIAIRFAVLCLYMVFSPIMFIGWVFPGFSKYSTDFWKGFLGQAFFAPAFLFMLYLSYRVTSTFNDPNVRSTPSVESLRNTGDLQSVLADSASSYVPLFTFFILTTVFLVGSMVVAKKMGAVGANASVDIGNRMRKSAQGGVTSWAGRNTVGRGSEWLAKQNDRMEGTAGGRFTKKLITAASLGTFDERTRRATFEAGKKAKFGGSYSRSDDKSFAKDVNNTQSTQRKKAETLAAITGLGELKALREKQQAAGGVLNAADTTKLATLEAQEAAWQSTITNLDTKQIEDLGSEKRAAIAHEFTSSQTESINKSDNLKDADKDKVNAKRSASVMAKISPTASTSKKDQGKNISKLTNGDLETLGSQWVMDNMHLLSNTQFDKVKDSKMFNENQRATLPDKRKTALKALAKTGTVDDFKMVMEDRKAEDIAKLPKEFFTNPLSLAHITEEVIKELTQKLDRKEKTDLENMIKTNPGAKASATEYFNRTIANNHRDRVW